MYQVLCIVYKNFKICLIFVFLLLTTPLVRAQTMSNNDYIIKTEDLNIASPLFIQNYNSKPVPSDPSVSEGVNFKVKSGFDNAASSLAFPVSLSSDIVDFGSLIPTNPIIRTVDLGIYNPSDSGYSVIASENNPLKSDKTIIPDTTCDNGQCNEENSGEWTNALTYGSGYRCDNLIGADCDSSFLSPNFYRHFADASNSQTPQVVMAGIGSQKSTGRLSYKVNISGNQAQGIYTNVITFIAVPNF